MKSDTQKTVTRATTSHKLALFCIPLDTWAAFYGATQLDPQFFM